MLLELNAKSVSTASESNETQMDPIFDEGMDWDAFRQQMPAANTLAYFDHAAVAPLSGPARDAIVNWSSQASAEGDVVWPNWAQRVEEIRATAAEMIGAKSTEVALVPNTTFGINMVAEGLDWRDGDNVVTLANEFPSNLYPWMNLQSRGVEARRVDVPHDGCIDLSTIANACDDSTRLIAVSWVGYGSGWRMDLDQLSQLAKEQGVLLFIDAIQGLGVFPVDVSRTKIDFLAADGHKWMLGPEGAGVFFVREEHLDQLRPLNVGWNSVDQRYNFDKIDLDIRRDASRYEGGSQNMVGMFGFGASLDLLRSYGTGPGSSSIAARILEVGDLACERLKSIGAEIHSERERSRSSGIISFSMPDKHPNMIRGRCMHAGVVVSCRSGRLRISPHCYNNEDDIDRLVEVLSRE